MMTTDMSNIGNEFYIFDIYIYTHTLVLIAPVPKAAHQEGV